MESQQAMKVGSVCVASQWVMGGMGTFSGLSRFSPGSLQPEALWTLLAERGTTFAPWGGTDSADHVRSLVSLNIITKDSSPGMGRRPQCWPCTPWLNELLMEQVLAQQTPASSLVGQGVTWRVQACGLGL